MEIWKILILSTAFSFLSMNISKTTVFNNLWARQLTRLEEISLSLHHWFEGRLSHCAPLPCAQLSFKLFIVPVRDRSIYIYNPLLLSNVALILFSQGLHLHSRGTSSQPLCDHPTLLICEMNGRNIYSFTNPEELGSVLTLERNNPNL